jgi:hypothetical protein
MNTKSKQSTDKTHSGTVWRIIGVLFGLFAFIWLATPEVNASLKLKSPPDCELTDSPPCGSTDQVTVFRWTRSENPRVHSYRVIFSDRRDFRNGIILELPEPGDEKIIAPQAAPLRKTGFDAQTTYYWRVVALDEFGGEVEKSQEVFSFWFPFLPFNGKFTVIAGLVKSDFNQLGLAGARVVLGSNAESANSIVTTEFNGKYIAIAFTDSGNSLVSCQIEITFTKDGFKPTTACLQPSFEQNGVVTHDLVMESIGDVDGDGIKDASENASTCLDADDADTDNDGIIDGDEDTNKNGVKDSGETDPCRLDTDNDGIQDGTERGYIISVISPDTDTAIFQPDLDPTTKTNPLDADSDKDGLFDGEEDLNHNGRVDAGETDPSPLTDSALPAILPFLLGD